jgi:hypothetical protein
MMQDKKNLQLKVDKYSKKIRSLQQAGSTLSEINYWRRELNRVYECIRERDKTERRMSNNIEM